jgi:hypothetical protein
MFKSHTFGKIASFNSRYNYNWHRRTNTTTNEDKKEVAEQTVKSVEESNYIENLKNFLTKNSLVIKYKKGDKSIEQIKKNFKGDGLQKLVKLRSDKKLEWSPQYYLNNQLTFLKDVMDNQILYLTLLEQEKVWNQSSEEEQSEEESDGFDDKSASEDDSDVEENNDEDNEGDVEENDDEDNDEDNEGDVEENDDEDNEGDDNKDKSDDETDNSED